MSTDNYLNRLVRRDWLTDGPLSNVVTSYIEKLRKDEYADRTILGYLGSLAHFSYWGKTGGVDLSSPDAVLVKQFLSCHLPSCHCPAPCYCAVASCGAALRHLLKIIPHEQVASVADNPVTAELRQFADYLTNTCGLAATTCDRRIHYVSALLVREFGTQTPVIEQLSVARLDAFFKELSARLRPASLGVVCTSLRSYFRYRALQGEATASLAAALPRIASWRHATMPQALSDSELEAFLMAFDCADPVGLRDYAMARCLVDLGLRGHEVTYLTMDSVNWRRGTITISSTKSKREQQLPLSESTGEAIAQYLRLGRPQTVNRALFVRHRAPFDKPLSVPAIRNSMNRAFVRCGLRDRFCNTHVLRRTTATRLQRSGASVKEIADLLRHQSLDIASAYARVDLERLRTVALPWPGRQS